MQLTKNTFCCSGLSIFCATNGPHGRPLMAVATQRFPNPVLKPSQNRFEEVGFPLDIPRDHLKLQICCSEKITAWTCRIPSRRRNRNMCHETFTCVKNETDINCNFRQQDNSGVVERCNMLWFPEPPLQLITNMGSAACKLMPWTQNNINDSWIRIMNGVSQIIQDGTACFLTRCPSIESMAKK